MLGIIILLFMPILGYGLYHIHLSFEKEQNWIAQQHQLELETKTEKYLFLITDGDNWLKQNHWHNAIFQYKEAVKLFPSDSDAHYRLALAYTYRCQAEQLNCANAIAQIEELIISQPNNADLYALRASLHYTYGDTVLAAHDYGEHAKRIHGH